MRRLRILLTYESFASQSGAVRVMAGEAHYLAARGHEVAILTTHAGPGLVTRTLSEGLTIAEAPGRPNPQRPELSYLRPGGGRAARRFVREWRPDAVHAHDICSLSRAAQGAVRPLGVPFAAHHHFSQDFVLRSLPSALRGSRAAQSALWPVVRMLARKFYNRCGAILAATQDSRDELRRWGVRSEIRIVANGVDLQRFTSGRRGDARERVNAFLGIPPELADDPMVLYSGRIDADKNVDTLLAAIPQVLSSERAIFVFAGDGSVREELRQSARAAPWSGRAHFPGFIPHASDMLPDLYAAADMAWTASPIEVQSLSLLEAMATGLPLVMSRHRALPELVEHGMNGYWIDTFDAAGYAGSAVALLRDPSLRQAFGQESVRRARGFDILETYRGIEGVLTGIAGVAEQQKPVRPVV